MLGVGIDGAERFHRVALGRGEDGVFKATRGGTHRDGGDRPDEQDRRVGAGIPAAARTGQCAAPAGTRPASADRRRGRTTVTPTNEGGQSRSEEGPPPIAHNG